MGERVALLGSASSHLARGTWYQSCATDMAIVLRKLGALKRKDAYKLTAATIQALCVSADRDVADGGQLQDNQR